MGAGQFFGLLLLIAGVLVALLCGLCTLVVIGVSLAAPVTHGQNYGGGAMIPVALVFGGLPTAVGAGMIWAGVALIRAGRKPPSSPPTTPTTDQGAGA
jgi:hypothetical protein